MFRFKKGMRAKLYNQVLAQDPEGMAGSSKGWDELVATLKGSSTEWRLLTARCARESVRDALKAFVKSDKENARK